MRSPRNTDLVIFCNLNYKRIRVIGVKNPSVIVTFNKKNWVVYKNVGQYIIIHGEDRFCVDTLEEIKKIIR